ncbi:MAG: hypothetical protein KYX69_19675 [Sphingomonas sp.]|uniref:hypothetical protein n=1 Tax=Sphingomonas sp. TaxID=28214 RepID=UPI0026307188|nr:hypothetical protein [Sphingomonas sp.]MDK2769924.1 hypothetical protein [Sphingomonas sp.]
MTVSSQINKSGPYDGNGATNVFDYEFRIIDETHIRVIKTSTLGIETVLALGSGFTVSGVGDAGGGYVTVSATPIVGEKITLIRDVPFRQDTDLENQGAYYAETVEAALDLAAMRDQQLQEQIDRAVTIPASSDGAELGGLVGAIVALGGVADSITIVAGVASEVVAVAGVADQVALVPDMVGLAREWAEKPVDATVTGTADGRSALHWAEQARISAADAEALADLIGATIYDFGLLSEDVVGSEDWGTI